MTRKEYKEERFDEILRDKATINYYQAKFKDIDTIIALQRLYDLLEQEKQSLINE